ncbi:MAG: NAD(P)H-dependent oxidoreductase [Bacteroidales bacterium]
MKKKRILNPYEAMSAMVELVMVDSHQEDRILQFYFQDIDLECFVMIGSKGVELHRSHSPEFDASLRCDFNDWLKLSSGRLNPLWGIITRRLKFQGDSSLFKLLRPAMHLDSPLEDLIPVSQRIARVPKSVVVLTASPRKEHGYTALLTSALVEGLRGVNTIDVRTVDISDYRIKSCTGCWHCWQRNAGDCIFKDSDDHALLANLLDSADMVVYAFPLYADGMPDKLKCYFDRHVSSLHPFMMRGVDTVCHPTRRMREDQSLVLLSLCGFPELSHFDSLRSHFRALAHNDHRFVAAELLRPAIMYLFNNPSLLDLQSQLLDDLRQAGLQLATKGFVSSSLIKRISAPVCNQEEFISFANGYWKGRLESRSGKDY